MKESQKLVLLKLQFFQPRTSLSPVASLSSPSILVTETSPKSPEILTALTEQFEMNTGSGEAIDNLSTTRIISGNKWSPKVSHSLFN